MIYNLLMFLAPETTISLSQAQASAPKPPATHRPVPGPLSTRIGNLKLIAGVAGNALGFALFLATCWAVLYLLSTM